MTEPRRLLETDGGSELTHALRATRTDVGAPERMSALHARLTQRLIAAEASGGVTHASGLASVKAWWLLGAALAGLGSAAVLWVTLADRRDARPIDARESSPRSAPSARSLSVPVATAPAGNEDPGRQALQVKSAQDMAQATQRVASTGEVLSSARSRVVANAKARLNAPVSPPRLSQLGSPERIDPDAEVALIASAQQLLDRDPARALAALDEHARRFTHGFLTEEREVLRFDALLSLERPADAATSARDFVARFPRSPQRARLVRWLASQPVAPRDHNTDAQHIPTE